MSNPQPVPGLNVSGNVVILCITGVLAMTFAAAVGLAWLHQDAGDIIAIIAAGTPATIAAIVGVAKLNQVATRMDRLEEVATVTATEVTEVKEQTNGKLQAAIQQSHQTAYESMCRALAERLDPPDHDDVSATPATRKP